MTFAEYEKVLVKSHLSIIDAVKMMNETSMQILIVVDEQRRLLGVVTDGDIRRAIIHEVDFQFPVQQIMTRNPVALPQPPDKKKALQIMREMEIRHIPLIDEATRVTGLLLWKDFFKNGDLDVRKKSNTVVIMAGGKGTRLDLFTKILPKPLIPVSEKPIIDHVMDNFAKYGFNRFLVSLKYKAEMIRMYFSDNHHDYNIQFVEEENFLGTAGCLALAGDRLAETFLVSNCDIIIDADLDSLFRYHIENRNHATILGTVQNIKIPYGVLKSHKADLDHIIEKPEYSFVINSGIYVLEPEIVSLIPPNQPMDMPDLLLSAKQAGMKVQIFPMTCSWFDVGQWGEYRRAIEHISAMTAAG